MKYVYIIILAVIAVFTTGAEARVIRNPKQTSTPVGYIRIDSVDYRANLTRVYGVILGRPHTSMRIDNIMMLERSKEYPAQDIDGIDFKRWFQFEEDGKIPVEIDFKKMRPGNSFNFNIKSTKGDIKCTIK